MPEIFSYLIAFSVIGIFAFAMFGGFSQNTSEKEKTELKEMLLKGGLILLVVGLLLGVITGEYKNEGGGGGGYSDPESDYEVPEYDTTP